MVEERDDLVADQSQHQSISELVQSNQLLKMGFLPDHERAFMNETVAKVDYLLHIRWHVNVALAEHPLKERFEFSGLLGRERGSLFECVCRHFQHHACLYSA